ncbi:MAG: hypothetical protein WAV56_04815 [Microgenomates group bacterium]
MDIKDQLTEILKGLELEPEIKGQLSARIEEGPITRSLIDDIVGLLEVKAREQDQIEKIEDKKEELYTKLADELAAVAAEEDEEGIKIMNQLGDDLKATSEEAKKIQAPVETQPTEETPQAPTL